MKSRPRVGLIGFGKTGRAVASVLLESPVDVIVDFSSSTGLELYGKAAAQRGITVVNAISSYESDRIVLLKQIGRKTKVMYSPNITLGINFLILAAKDTMEDLMLPYFQIEKLPQHFLFHRSDASLESPEGSLKR